MTTEENLLQVFRSKRPVKTVLKEEEKQKLLELYGTKWINTAKLREVAETSGVPYKRGKYSESERRALHDEVETFLREQQMERTAFLNSIFNRRGNKRNGDFFVRVAQRLPGRPILLVYHYLRRQLFTNQKGYHWTSEQDASLKRLFLVHGPKWFEIGRELGRFGTACRDRYRVIREQYAKGYWSEEETALLLETVNRLNAERERDPVGCDLTWFWVSEQVKTRSPSQCHSKYITLFYKQKRPAKFKWSDHQDRLLVERLYDRCLEDESEIIWRDVWEEDSVWREYWHVEKLRTRWQMLKRRASIERGSLDDFLEALLLTFPQGEVDNSFEPDSD